MGYKIDIGGGLASPLGYINIDPVHGEGQFKRRIQDGIPCPDRSVDWVRASHVLEHIPAGAERLALFKDVYRVLVPSGCFEIFVPLFPSWGAVADPTHVSFWVPQSFWYFTGQMGPAANYGMDHWEMASWSTKEYDWGTEGHATLRKPPR